MCTRLICFRKVTRRSTSKWDTKRFRKYQKWRNSEGKLLLSNFNGFKPN